MSTVTYCPEDNKLRLYIGRVSRDEYEKLRAAGFKPMPKQREDGRGDFVATWTPSREDVAAQYLEEGEDIGDEDYSPEERSADRAERFEGYRDNRRDEANDRADAFSSGPQAFGHQSAARAERQARRHDRHRTHAVSQWGKAEYWQQRTAGVIRSAIYKSSAAVRRTRIKRLEAGQRKHLKHIEEAAKRYNAWKSLLTMDGAELPLPENISECNTAQRIAYTLANVGSFWWHGYYPSNEAANDKAREIWKHGFSAYDFLTKTEFCGIPVEKLAPRQVAEMYLAGTADPTDEDTGSQRWARHYELRLGYERAMLGEDGGAASECTMEPGGWIYSRGRARGCLNDAAAGWLQIQKVNKSPATGAVTSVQVLGTTSGYTAESDHTKYETRPALVTVDVERLPAEAYRAPTDEEREAFTEKKKANKKPPVAFINPTPEDAQRLQNYLNQQAADYARQKGKAPSKPRTVEETTQAQYSRYSGENSIYFTKLFSMGGTAFKVRMRNRGFYDYSAADSVVVLTDKPQKTLPVEWAQVETAEAPATTSEPAPAGCLF